MAYLVKTTGKFGVMDPATKEDLSSTRPGILHRDDFINLLMSRKQIKVIASDLVDSVTDKDFAKYWHEAESSKDQETLAIASFLSKYQADEDPELPPEDLLIHEEVQEETQEEVQETKPPKRANNRKANKKK